MYIRQTLFMTPYEAVETNLGTLTKGVRLKISPEKHLYLLRHG